MLIRIGTKQPIWLDGKLPDSDTETTVLKARAVCQGCNIEPWDVRAKKCKEHPKEFFIYQLSSVQSCPMAYCAGILKRLIYIGTHDVVFTSIQRCSDVKNCCYNVETKFN